MTKRVLILALASVLILSAFAVGQNKSAMKTEGFTYTSEPVSEPPYTIGISNYSLVNSWRVQMMEEARYSVEQNSHLIEEVFVTNAQGSISKQISDIEDLITKGVDAICVTAISPKALVPVVEKAMDKGIVVVDFSQTVNTEKTTSSVVIDQKEFGRVGAEWLVEDLDGEGKIIVFNGVKGTSTSQYRWQGAKEVFDDYPDIEVLQQVNADWAYSKAKSAMEDILPSYPEIDGIWSQGGAMTQAAIDAFVARGRPLVPMTGEDNNGFLKAWAEHQGEDEFGSIAVSMPTYISSAAVEVALAALQGHPYFHQLVIPIPTITADEIDEYIKPNLPDSYWANSRLPADIVKDLFER